MDVTLISIEAGPSLILPVMQEILIQNNHHCKYIHVSLGKYNDKFLENISDQIVNLSKNSKLIGISTMSNSFPACVALIKKLKNKSNAKILIGGIHPTVKPFEVLEYADYICVGEGEEALLDLVNRLDTNQRTDNILNIYTKLNGKIKTNPLRPLIKDLNKLPVPTFNLNNIYFCYEGIIYPLSERKDLIKRFYEKYYFIISSRGCPYNCGYCLSSALNKLDPNFRVIRRRSDDHILYELKNLLSIYNDKIIIGFVDDDFCAQSESNLLSFLKKYREEIKLPFFAATTPTSMTENKIFSLVEAGLVRLEIGVQSINDTVNREIYNRYATKTSVLNIIKMVSKYRHKIQICYDIILDNPWEKDDTKIETLRFLYTIPKPVTIWMFSLTLYPGTALYQSAKNEGIIKDDYEQIYLKNHMILNVDDSINTLFILYTKYYVPKSLIEIGIKLRRIYFIKYLMSKATTPLWVFYNYLGGLYYAFYGRRVNEREGHAAYKK